MEDPLEFLAALDRGDVPAMARLLDCRPHSIGERIHGATPLHRAAARGDLAMLELLLERGAAIDEQDEAGATALAWATDERRDPAVDLLLARGARATAVDLAARGRLDELLGLLDEEPWMVDQATSQGTALHAAVRRGRLDVARALIERGADWRRRDDEGRTALELAAELEDSTAAGAAGATGAARAIRALLRAAGTMRAAWGSVDAHASEEVSYRCGACSEEIVIDLDRTEGEEQRIVEDCPVCCRANVIEVRFARGGPVARAELE